LHQQSLSFAQRPPSQQQPRDQREHPWQPAFGMPGGGSGTGDELTPTDGACLGGGGDAGWGFMLDGSGGDAGDNLITVATTTGGIRLHRCCTQTTTAAAPTCIYLHRLAMSWSWPGHFALAEGCHSQRERALHLPAALPVATSVPSRGNLPVNGAF
jgi:hypothetical protein